MLRGGKEELGIGIGIDCLRSDEMGQEVVYKLNGRLWNKGGQQGKMWLW